MHLSVHHDSIFSADARNDRAQSAKQGPERHGANGYFVLLVDHQDVALALVVADGRIGHQQRVIASASRHAQPGKGAWGQPSRFVLQNAAHAHRARRRIDVVVDEIDDPFMGKTGFVFKLDKAWYPSVSRAEQFSFLGEFLVLQHRMFVDVDIAIDRGYRLDRRQRRGLTRAAVDQIANRHFFVTDAPINRRQDPAPFQVQPRRFHRGLCGSDRRRGLFHDGVGIVHVLLRDGADIVFLQSQQAAECHFGDGQRGLGLLSVGLFGVEVGLERPIVDHGQHISPLDDGPFLERHLDD